MISFQRANSKQWRKEGFTCLRQTVILWKEITPNLFCLTFVKCNYGICTVVCVNLIRIWILFLHMTIHQYLIGICCPECVMHQQILHFLMCSFKMFYLRKIFEKKVTRENMQNTGCYILGINIDRSYNAASLLPPTPTMNISFWNVFSFWMFIYSSHLLYSNSSLSRPPSGSSSTVFSVQNVFWLWL